MQRVLVLHGEAATTGYSSRGVVAGCTIETSLVKLCCLLDLDKVVRLRPSVLLHVFIDNSHPSAQGPLGKVLKEIVKAEKHLHVVFVTVKTAVISSHRRVAVVKQQTMGLCVALALATQRTRA